MVDSPEVRARRIARPLWNLACRAVGGDADSLTADDWGALIAGGLATGPDQIAEGWQGLIESYLNTPVAFRVVSTYQGLLYEASLAIGPASVCVLERFKTRPGPDGGERPVAHDEQLEVAATTGHPLLLLQRVLPPAAELRAPALQTSAINAVPVTLDPATGERLAAVLAANPDADAAELGGEPVLGLESQSLAPIGFDPRGPALITGPRQSGRTSALRWFAESIRRWSPGTRLYLLGTRRSVLASWPGWTAVKSGATEVDDFVRDTLMPRLELEADPAGKPGLAVFVEGLPDFDAGMAEMSLTDALAAARRNGHPFFTEGEVTEVSGYGSLMTEARQARAGFILQPETADEGLFRTPLGRCNRGDFPPGRGLWVRAGKTSRVQLPLVD